MLQSRPDRTYHSRISVSNDLLIHRLRERRRVRRGCVPKGVSEWHNAYRADAGPGHQSVGPWCGGWGLGVSSIRTEPTTSSTIEAHHTGR